MAKRQSKAEQIPDVQRRPDAERRLRQAARLARLLPILELLQSRGRWNAKDLAADLEVSERTAYRDLTHIWQWCLLSFQ